MGIGLKNSETATLVSAIDRHYLLPWAAMISSFRKHNPNRDTTAYILHYDLTNDDVKFIERVSKITGIETKVVAMPAYPFIMFSTRRRSSLAARSTMSPIAYAKTAIDALLPGTIDRALLIDADIVVTASLDELLDWELKSPLAAVGNIPRKHGHQFNSGVVLADLREWRRRGVWAASSKFLFEYSDSLHGHDQHTLNLFFANEWDKLDLRFNYIEDHYRLIERNQNFTKDQILNARNSPAIVHFAIGGDKPWRKSCQHPRPELYTDWIEQLSPALSDLDILVPT